jgi:hypothetical protein
MTEKERDLIRKKWEQELAFILVFLTKGELPFNGLPDGDQARLLTDERF